MKVDLMRALFFWVVCGILALAGLSGARAGETEKIIELNITGSQTTHPSRTYDVCLSNPTNATIGTPGCTTLTINSGTGAVLPDVAIRMIDPIVDRGGLAGTTQRFAIDRGGDTSGSVTVSYAVSGTGDTPAIASDFTGGVFPAGSVTFVPAETSKTITLGIAGKAAPSPTVGYTLTLSNPIGANIGVPATAVAQVQNSGAAQVTWSVSSASITVDRGENGITQSVDISRTSGAGSATIDFIAAPGGSSPASAADFVPAGFPGATLTFADLETVRRITWNIAGKPGAGIPLTYDIVISSPSGGGSVGIGSIRLTINDSGPQPNVTLPLRLDSGSTTLFTDSENNQWGADTYYVGGTVITTASAIAGTVEDTLFAKQRMGGPVKYELHGLPTGQTYDATFYFAEIDAAQAGACTVGVSGARRMDFYSNDVAVAADIDPCKAVGHLTAYTREYAGLTADAEGKMVLELRANAGGTILPALAGMWVKVHEAPPTAERFLTFGQPGRTYTDDSGRGWINGDQYATGCNATYDGELAIVGTNDPELYRGRCNNQTLSLAIPVDVTGGTSKTVYLGFSEHTVTAVAQRVMNITVEGVTAATGLDILAAAGGPDHAYRLRQDVTITGGVLNVTLTGTTGTAQINNISIINPTVAPTLTYLASIGWKSEFIMPKNAIVRAFAPPRGIAASGNPLVIRSIDDTSSTMFVNNSPCPASPSHGLKTDTTATNQNFYLCIQSWNPANHSASLFTLAKNTSVIDEFTVQVCEIDRTTGSTLNCQPFTVGVRVSRAGN